MQLRSLRAAALVELVSLVVLLVNLSTVHLESVTAVMGPAHGCAYLVVVVAAWRSASATAMVRILALLPGVGGLVVLRLLTDPRSV
ncbi:DUF3817 domain-containing protein [Melissospora conviva]|uniref:DUF3817 domain-containing protein n=1 Tax=Melissospora conviva TaxID=3388432 RepID=UPI003B7BBFE9